MVIQKLSKTLYQMNQDYYEEDMSLWTNMKNMSELKCKHDILNKYW